MKQNKIIGDKKPGNLDDLFRQAQEDSAFREAFGERVEKSEEKSFELVKQTMPETELKSNSHGKNLRLEEIMSHGGLKWNVRAVDFTDDSKYLAIGYGHGTLKIVYIPQIEDGVRQDMGSDVRGISIDTTGGHIAVGTKKGKLMIYKTNFSGYHLNTHLAKPIAVAKLPSRINDVAFDKNGENIAVVGGKHGKKNGFLKTYSFFPKGQIGLPKHFPFREDLHISPLTAVAFTPDDKNILVGGEMLQLYPTNDLRKDPKLVEQANGWTTALAFSPDGKYLATGHADLLRVYEWKPNSRHLPVLATLNFPNDIIIHGLSFSPDGKYLAATGGIPHRKTDQGKCGFIKVFEVK